MEAMAEHQMLTIHIIDKNNNQNRFPFQKTSKKLYEHRRSRDGRAERSLQFLISNINNKNINNNNTMKIRIITIKQNRLPQWMETKRRWIIKIEEGDEGSCGEG